MSILIDRNTPVIVQGITGKMARFHTEDMVKYGTNVVGGVVPGKGGMEVEGLPVFDTVAGLGLTLKRHMSTRPSLTGGLQAYSQSHCPPTVTCLTPSKSMVAGIRTLVTSMSAS